MASGMMVLIYTCHMVNLETSPLLANGNRKLPISDKRQLRLTELSHRVIIINYAGPNYPTKIYESFRHTHREALAEGARFELAVHGVHAGFQDRWFQPLTHPSPGSN